MAAPRATPSTWCGAAAGFVPGPAGQPLGRQRSRWFAERRRPRLPGCRPGERRISSTASAISISAGVNADDNPGRNDSNHGFFRWRRGQRSRHIPILVLGRLGQWQSTGRRNSPRTGRGEGRSVRRPRRCDLRMPARGRAANPAGWIPERAVQLVERRQPPKRRGCRNCHGNGARTGAPIISRVRCSVNPDNETLVAASKSPVAGRQAPGCNPFGALPGYAPGPLLLLRFRRVPSASPVESCRTDPCIRLPPTPGRSRQLGTPASP